MRKRAWSRRRRTSRFGWRNALRLIASGLPLRKVARRLGCRIGQLRRRLEREERKMGQP